MKTLAAVSYESGKPMVIEELELDEPKSDDVLVKMTAVGLCHSDYHALVGNRPGSGRDQRGAADQAAPRLPGNPGRFLRRTKRGVDESGVIIKNKAR